MYSVQFVSDESKISIKGQIFICTRESLLEAIFGFDSVARAIKNIFDSSIDTGDSVATELAAPYALYERRCTGVYSLLAGFPFVY